MTLGLRSIYAVCAWFWQWLFYLVGLSGAHGVSIDGVARSSKSIPRKHIPSKRKPTGPSKQAGPGITESSGRVFGKFPGWEKLRISMDRCQEEFICNDMRQRRVGRRTKRRTQHRYGVHRTFSRQLKWRRCILPSLPIPPKLFFVDNPAFAAFSFYELCSSNICTAFKAHVF